MRMELFQIGIILRVGIVKDAIKRASLVNDILPSPFKDRYIWLVVPAGFAEPLENVWMSFDNRMMSGVIRLNYDKSFFLQNL